MKKKILLITLILVFTVVLLVGCSAPTVERDKEPLVTEWSSYALLMEFVNAYPQRTSGDKTNITSDGKLQVDLSAEWIASKMVGYGYTANNGGLVKFSYENPYRDNRIEETNNVIFRKDNPTTDKQVIVGAHYDNATGITLSNKAIGGDGVYNNAVGVVALLQLASQIKSVELPFDVEFIFFGAGEMGRKGSVKYISSMTDSTIADTLLMVNYDRVVGGDNLYMYTDEVAWQHESLFYNVANDNKYNVTAIPSNKRPALYSTIEGSNMMYYNEFMLSDNFPFLSKGMATISFTSMNVSSRANAAYVEIDGKKNVDYTQSDTLLDMKERLGGGARGEANISSGIDSVVSITIKALTGSDFIKNMEASLAAKPNYTDIANYETMQIVGWSMVAAIIVILLTIYFIIKSKLVKHDVIVESPRGYINMTKGVIVFNGETPAAPPADPFDNTPQCSGGTLTHNNNNNDDNDKDIFGDY